MFSFDKKRALWAVGGLAVGALSVGAVWGAVNENGKNLRDFGAGEVGQMRGGQIEREERGQGMGSSEGAGKCGSGNQGQGKGCQGQCKGLGNGFGNGSHRGGCMYDGGLTSDASVPTKVLSASAKSALDLAIADEYKAKATYESIMRQFGNMRPFSNIVLAEEQHISTLKALYDRYGVSVPVDTTSDIPSFASKEDACKAGVSAEEENASLYKDTLLPKVKEYEDITQVFTRLMEASKENHLPAFERCQ